MAQQQTRTFLRPLAIALAMLWLTPQSLSAYLQQLTEENVAEAYALGQRRDSQTGAFFNRYEKTFTGPHSKGPRSSGPQVRAVSVRTPYSLAVWRSYQGAATYTLPKAQADYQASANKLEVVVWIDVPMRYAQNLAGLQGPAAEFWRSFTVELSQENKIAARRVSGQQNVFSGDTGGVAVAATAEVHAEYDFRDVASAPVRVVVTGPDGRKVSAEFDLEKLR
jgi:hypothetical protein